MSILFPSYSMGLFSLIVIILSLPILSLIIRRLHDSERKGSWILLIVAPLLIAMATWTYSTFFFSKGERKEESKMIQYDETENLDIYVMPNGDTVCITSLIGPAVTCLKHKPNPVTPQLQLLSPHHPLVSPAL